MEKKSHSNMRITKRTLKQFIAVGCLTALAACGGGGSDPSFPLNVEVSGLTQGGLVLQNKGVDPLTIPGNGIFKFSKNVPNNGDYVVTVRTDPPTQKCSITANGSGSKVTKTIPVVKVSCVAKSSTVSVGGSVSGLAAGASFTLQNNEANDLTISANDTTYAFQVPYGSDYSIDVSQQPKNGQTCSVDAATATGKASANITNVNVTCATETFWVGGTVKGLEAGKSVIIKNGTSNSRQVDGNGTDMEFTFPNPMPKGSIYAVEIPADGQPVGQTCNVTKNGTGTVNAEVKDIEVQCDSTTKSYPVSVNVTSLLPGYSVVLEELIEGNPSETVTRKTTGKFDFDTKVLQGKTYEVKVKNYPFLQTCELSNASGTANGQAIEVSVKCEIAPTNIIHHFPEAKAGEPRYHPVGLMALSAATDTTLVGTATTNIINDGKYNGKTGYLFEMQPADPTSFNIKNDFAGSGDFDKQNPAFPTGLIEVNGDIYGTTYLGGSTTYGGAIFLRTSGGNFNQTLNSFLSDNQGSVADLTPDVAADGKSVVFYGVTYGNVFADQNTSGGSIFMRAAGSNGAVGTLHQFTVGDAVNGYRPNGKLAITKEGSPNPATFLYGVTEKGGAHGKGTVFKYDVANKSIVFVQSFVEGSFPNHPFKDLYVFTNPYENPYSGLLEASDGNFYGVAKYGGDYDQGKIFKFTKDGQLSTVYSFDVTKGENGYPSNDLIQLADGKLYGVARGQHDTNNKGIIFRIALPTAEVPNPALEILHTFSATNVDDGQEPNTRLVLGKDGNLYGTTQYGGEDSQGTIFKLGR